MQAHTAQVWKLFSRVTRYPEGAVTMLYAGDDAEAKQAAARLASDLGFEPVDAGPLVKARPALGCA